MIEIADLVRTYRMGEFEVKALDGVSLTVNEVDAEGFEVALIPHTVSHTAFAQTKPGDAVNLEIDLVARYVERLLGNSVQESQA